MGDDGERWIRLRGVRHFELPRKHGAQRGKPSLDHVEVVGEERRPGECREGLRLMTGDALADGDGEAVVDSDHRSASSSATRASVDGSRCFTTTAVFTEMPCDRAKSPAAGRDPGTTTAPAGTTRGASGVPTYS